MVNRRRLNTILNLILLVEMKFSLSHFLVHLKLNMHPCGNFSLPLAAFF